MQPDQSDSRNARPRFLGEFELASSDEAIPDDLFDSNDTANGGKLRFSILSLLIAMAMIAVGIVLLKFFWLFGFVAIFALSMGCELWFWQNRSRDRQILSAAVWGIVFPILCVFYDPGLLHDPWIDPQGPINFPRGLKTEFRITMDSVLSLRSALSLPAIALECATLGMWIVVQPRSRWLADIYAGVLAFGFVVALVIGICILPLTIMGLVILIGILGVTPFMTCRAYLFATRESLRLSKAIGTERDRVLSRAIQISSFLLAASIPLACAFIFRLRGISFF